MNDPIYRLPPYQVHSTVIALAETVPWPLIFGGIPAHWKVTRGEGINVGIADTGIDPEHPDLRDALKNARDFSGSPYAEVDVQGHGSHVAGTIAATGGNDIGVVGVADKAKLLIAKVLGDDGSGSDQSVSEGIVWLADQGANIISMSLGSPMGSQRIKQAIEHALRKGVYIVCAAGNDGRENSVNYPAKWPFSVAVGAHDKQGRVAPFSSRGPEVTVSAPGVEVLSTFRDGKYGTLSGTSMATPFVAGVVALLLARAKVPGVRTPVTDQASLIAHLKATAKDAGSAGPDSAYGAGLLNPDSLLSVPDPPDHGEPSEFTFGGIVVHTPAKAGDVLSFGIAVNKP